MRLRGWSAVGAVVMCGALACLLACVSGRYSRDTLAQRPRPVPRLEPLQEATRSTEPGEITVATLCIQIEVCEVNRVALPGLGEEHAAVCENPLTARILRGDLVTASFQRTDVDACVARLTDAGILRIACKATAATTSGQRLIFQPPQDADAPVVDDGDAETETRLQLVGLPTELCVVPTVTGKNHFLLHTSGLPGTDRVESDSTPDDDDRPLELTTKLGAGEVLVITGEIRPPKQSKSGIAQIIQVAFRSQAFAGARPATKDPYLVVIVSPKALDTQHLADVAPQPDGGSSETGQRNSRWLRTLPQ